MVNTFFGLTTGVQLQSVTIDRDRLARLYRDANSELQRLDFESRAFERELTAIRAKCEAMTQELADCKTWANHLEETNKEQAALIGEQINAINAAEMLYNQATVECHQYKTAVKIAADNFILQITK